jgi:hypothetical protein
MPEGISEQERGEPVRTVNRYWVKLARDNQELFDTINEHKLKLAYPLQIFYTTEFESRPLFQNPTKEGDNLIKARSALSKYLTDKNVIDF